MRNNRGDILSLLQRIRPVSLPHVSRYSLTTKLPLPIDPQGQYEIKELIKHLSFLSKLAPYPAYEYIMKAMGYEKHLMKLEQENPSASFIHTNTYTANHTNSHAQSYATGHMSEMNTFTETLMILKDILRSFPTQRAFLDFMNNDDSNMFTTNSSEIGFTDGRVSVANKIETAKSGTDARTDALQIRTMHSSKGLEYEVVYIPDLNKGIIPDSRAAGDAIEEERRLLYVAMTRARRHLQLFYLERIRGKRVHPSIFVKELF